jgi:hypothetical protein
MSQVQRTVNHCDICNHEWIPTPGVVYTHCTSGKCRSRKWDRKDIPATITLNNLSQAVASADAHRDFAITAGVLGNKALARKHDRHAKAIMAEVMSLTSSDNTMSADDLLAELMA